MNTVPIHLPGCTIDEVQVAENQLMIKAHTHSREAKCPTCDTSSARVHSYYQRTPRDLPISESRVHLQLTTKRFRCLNPHCPQQIFTERLPDLLAPYARCTQRLIQACYHVGQALGGEAAARLLDRLRMPISGDTVLRLLRRGSEHRFVQPQVLGVDDWAWRKGRTYGTILVDLQQHRVVDLLPDRTAKTLADWLRDHPGVDIIARDRSTEYAKGIADGAPAARQVADRWHLLQNLYQALERLIGHSYARLKALPELETRTSHHTIVPSSHVQRGRFPRSTGDEEAKKASRDRQLARYKEIQRLRRKGRTIHQIAQQLDMHRATVRRHFYAETFPERNPNPPVKSMLDPFLPYLDTRHHDGCENARQLWREIQAQGYPGKYCQVAKWLRQRRRQPAPNTRQKYRSAPADTAAPLSRATTLSLPSTRQLAWLAVRDPNFLNSEENLLLKRICQDKTIHAAVQLAQQFSCLIRIGLVSKLHEWLDVCLTSPIEAMRNFARGIQMDIDAVRAALELPWSNGQTEGQINRLKVIKRQMYGRASLDLLRIRACYLPS